jgi:hypothetical protein
MLHLIIGTLVMVGITYFVISMVVLAARLMWLAVLIVGWCIAASATAALAIALGAQKFAQAVDDWRWRRRYGEVLPPE